MTLTARQRDVLRWLDDERWQTPMEIGATDRSHHSGTLMQLVKKGLVETKKLHAIYCPNGMTQRIGKRGEITDGHPPYEGCRCKGSRRYRRTPAGRRVARSDLGP